MLSVALSKEPLFFELNGGNLGVCTSERGRSSFFGGPIFSFSASVKYSYLLPSPKSSVDISGHHQESPSLLGGRHPFKVGGLQLKFLNY